MKRVDTMRGQSKADLRRRQPRLAGYRLVLLALILLAFALRIYRLDGQSLWYDEGVTAQVAAQGLSELTRWTADDIQPPLYYVLVAAWMRLAGRSEWALRFPSALFGALTVPLLYVLGRRLFHRRAALLAALLATLSPLYVYYSQEARMYTLLTFLGALAAYLLLRLLGERGTARRRGLWAAFALTAIAALYTHYFAAFLLAAFALYFLLTILRHAPRPPRAPSPITFRVSRLTFYVSRFTFHVSRFTFHVLLLEASITFLAIVLAYTPWLPAMLSRFRVDASYWQGTLKLNEALRHVLISFSLGETVLEPLAIRLMWGFAIILALSVLTLIWHGQSRITHHASRITHHPPSFLLLYLFVPLALILLLSYRNPKFNPRYLMLASPAFLLLIAGGLSTLLSFPYPPTRTSRNPQGEISPPRHKGTKGKTKRGFVSWCLRG